MELLLVKRHPALVGRLISMHRIFCAGTIVGRVAYGYFMTGVMRLELREWCRSHACSWRDR